MELSDTVVSYLTQQSIVQRSQRNLAVTGMLIAVVAAILTAVWFAPWVAGAFTVAALAQGLVAWVRHRQLNKTRNVVRQAHDRTGQTQDEWMETVREWGPEGEGVLPDVQAVRDELAWEAPDEELPMPKILKKRSDKT